MLKTVIAIGDATAQIVVTAAFRAYLWTMWQIILLARKIKK